MKNLIFTLALLISFIGFSQTPITNANFQVAINTCLSTNPDDGMCSGSEYGAMPDWDVSQVTDMSNAFSNKYDFNGDLSSWDTSNVTTMGYMFYFASSFNQPLDWDVSNVIIMYNMFYLASSFNQPLDWDLNSLTDMGGMFTQALAFNSDISSWNVENVLYMNWMFDYSGISVNSYDGILNSWSQQNVQSGVVFGAVGINYCNGADARQSLIDNHNWFFTDGGLDCSNSCSITAPSDITIVGCDNISNFGEASSDCSDSSSITNDAPAFFELGETTVTWTVTDGSGNTATDTQSVTVTDDVNPTITAPTSVDVSTNDGCNAINVSLGSATTSDNCSVGSVTSDAPTSFDIGETTVTWTVTDESGNTSTDTQTVVVTDNSNPTVICNELSLTLENGVAEISVNDIDNGSFDECGEITLEINQTNFDESHIGDNIVVLTVTDEYGNSSSCESTVTVEAGMSLVDNSLSNISLFPNPSSSFVFIRGTDHVNLKIVVFDITGKKVTNKITNNKIDISLLEKGVYFVNISNGINTSLHKIIKN